MATQRTIVRKITVGIPIRRVTGASAQRMNDLLDVNITSVQDDHILQYEASTGLWKNEPLITGGTF
jgi:hypothetical protein